MKCDVCISGSIAVFNVFFCARTHKFVDEFIYMRIIIAFTCNVFVFINPKLHSLIMHS